MKTKRMLDVLINEDGRVKQLLRVFIFEARTCKGLEKLENIITLRLSPTYKPLSLTDCFS